jgi:Na+/melibiose symporter-like transporter
MALEHERLSVKEKVGYGIGDAAANFIFQTMIIFQLAFYTDTFGITAAAAGTLFLVVRVFDAAFDPLMGVIADRTNTRWGKFRPWILWTAVPFGIMGFLAFTTPDLTPSGKLAYAYVTYILLMMVYSANNLPYSALSGVMTGDVVQRTSLSSYRMVAAWRRSSSSRGSRCRWSSSSAAATMRWATRSRWESSPRSPSCSSSSPSPRRASACIPIRRRRAPSARTSPTS